MAPSHSYFLCDFHASINKGDVVDLAMAVVIAGAFGKLLDAVLSQSRRAELHPCAHLQLHQGLLAQGEHLTHRCQGWTDDMTRQRGWAPEGA